MRKVSRRLIGWTVAAGVALGTVALAQKRTTLFVTVVATDKGPMADLQAKDFIAKGPKAEVTDAVHATEPLSIELLVDVSRQPYGTNPPIQDVRTALRAFVERIRAADPAARIALMQVGNAAVTVVGFEAPPAALDKAVGMVAPGPETGAVLIEGVQDAGRALAKLPAPRRAIVSVDFASNDPIPDIAADGIVKEVFTSGASIWAISVGGTARQSATRENALNAIVKNNGGLRVTIVAATGLSSQLQMVANSLLSQYALTIGGVDSSHVRDLKLSTESGAKVLPSVFAR